MVNIASFKLKHQRLLNGLLDIDHEAYLKLLFKTIFPRLYLLPRKVINAYQYYPKCWKFLLQNLELISKFDILKGGSASGPKWLKQYTSRNMSSRCYKYNSHFIRERIKTIGGGKLKLQKGQILWLCGLQAYLLTR